MTEDLTISTENNVRVSIDEWDDGGVWLFLQGRQASMSTILTLKEAEQLLANLQTVLGK